MKKKGLRTQEWAKASPRVSPVELAEHSKHAGYREQYQLLQMIVTILNLNSSVLLAQLGNIFQYSFAQLRWVNTGFVSIRPVELGEYWKI